MKRAIPLALAVGIFTTMIFLLFQTPNAVHSARWAVHMALAVVIPAFPLALGCAAIDGVICASNRTRSLVAAFPWRSRFSLGMNRISICAAGGCIGLSLGSACALAIAWINGSSPSWQALVLLPLAGIYVSGGCALGWVIGVVTGSWLVPPLLTVLSFAAVIINFPYSRTPLALFEGSTSDFVFLLPSPVVYATTFLWALSIGLLAVILLLCWSVRGSWISISLAVMTLGLSVVCAVAMAQTSWGAEYNEELNVYENPAEWPCTQILDTDASVCIPIDQVSDLQQVASSLTNIHKNVVMLAPSLSGRSWRPMDYPLNESLVYELPINQSSSAGSTAAFWLVRDCFFERSETMMDEATESITKIEQWLDSGNESFELGDNSERDHMLKEAATAFRSLTSCS